jgi:putative transposase
METNLAGGGRAVGIDLGIAHFAADSDGNFAESPQYLQQSLSKVQKLQKALSRKKKASKRHQKAARCAGTKQTRGGARF